MKFTFLDRCSTVPLTSSVVRIARCTDYPETIGNARDDQPGPPETMSHGFIGGLGLGERKTGDEITMTNSCFHTA